MKKLNIDKKQLNRMWWILLGVSAIGLILMAVYELGFYTQGTKPSSHTAGDEKLFFFFYFTFISNMFGLVVAAIQSSRKISDESKHFQRIKVMMATNLTLTMIVYWAMLAPHATWNDGLAIVQNIFIHLITPVLAILVFLAESFNKEYKTNIDVKKTTAINFVFPVIWLLVAVIIYFALGAKPNSGVYAFLNFKNQAWYMSVAYILGIGIAYPAFTTLFSWIFTKEKNKARN